MRWDDWSKTTFNANEPVKKYIKHSDEEETIGDILNTLNKKQRAVVDYLIYQALQQKPNEEK